MARIIKWLISVTFVITSLQTIHSRDLTVQRRARENQVDVCDSAHFTSEDKVQCVCKKMFFGNISFPYKADCIITQNNIANDDDIWRSFSSINTVEEIVFASNGESFISYVPTLALKAMRDLITITIKLGRVHTIQAYAFANSTNVQIIKLSGNDIHTLSVHAFAHHPNLTSLNLDRNKITEIRRNVFKHLPQLQELYLGNNKIFTIHDRAFLHLGGLRNLDLKNNSIFVLTNETLLGLVNLTQLDLQNNNLEVIGDNTFASLTSLKSLILRYNKIKILDDKAFHGSIRLESLSLAHNNLTELTNARVFADLTSLAVLDLKSNAMRRLSPDVISPILHNFYSVGSSIGFEDNLFPCDCKLNWFLTLKNHTRNTYLQDTIDNLMCYPSAKLSEDYKKYEDNEKLKKEDVQNNSSNADYDYYDDSSLQGRMFFSDIPSFLIPCESESTTQISVVNLIPITTLQATTLRPRQQTHHEITTEKHIQRVTNTVSPSYHESPHYVSDPQTSRSYPSTVPPSSVINRIDTTTSLKSETISTRRYTSVSRHLNPTEEMVKDAFETTSKPATINNAERTKIKKAVDGQSTDLIPSAATSKRDDDKMSIDVIQVDNTSSTKPAELTETIDKPQSSPESASHVHVSGASLRIHSELLTLVMLMFLIFNRVRLL